jgi:tetratricopeptide (TPR) repeat protein
MADNTAPQHLLAQAMERHRVGALEVADALYKEFLDAEPEHAQALRLHGILLRDRGELRASSELLERAVECAPDNDPEPVSELALTCMAGGDLDQAEYALRVAVRRDANSIRALSNLGALLQHRGHAEAATDFYRRVLALEPDDWEIRCNLASALLESGRGEEAVAECDRMLDRMPGDPLLMANKGAVLCGLQDYPAAIDVLQRAVAQNPGDDMALTNLGYARMRLGELDSSADTLIKAVRINPDNARAASDLINVLAAVERGDEALHIGEAFLARHPGERLVLAAYAYALNDQGRIDESRAIFDYENLITITDVDTAEGFATLDDFHSALVDEVTRHPSLLANPGGKATEGGSQTGELNLNSEPALIALQSIINQAVNDSAGNWSESFANHPAMACAAPEWTLRCWGTVLSAGGRQQPHMHPLSWLSGVYYARLPADMTADKTEAGWIEFGAPPDRYRMSTLPALRTIEPKEGRLLLFPSYFYHRTLQFDSAESRVSLAFDVMPQVV